VVSGFYADPKKFDARSRHTPVERRDVHFWTEVYIGGGMWQTLEPTPGYEVLLPPPGVGERIAAAALAVWRFLGEHLTASLIGLVVLAVAWARRIVILDALHTAIWRLTIGNDPRLVIVRTLRLLDGRCRWTGRARPAARTPAGWFLQRVALEPAERETIVRFFDLADWAAFGPALERCPRNCTADAVYDVCRTALDVGSIVRLDQSHPRNTRMIERIIKFRRFRFDTKGVVTRP
jgi:hypothetical protein